VSGVTLYLSDFKRSLVGGAACCLPRAAAIALRQWGQSRWRRWQ
jgi:hypothetical protein